MIGCNQLVLNKATMMEALQLWLAKEIPANTPKVTDIKEDKIGASFLVDIKNETN